MSLTFCGASVRAFSSSIGWHGQKTTFRCSVVEDPDNGDFFAPPAVGTPVYFTYNNFKFAGLLQKWTQSNSPEGLPVFDLECVDPRDILDGAQIITGGYRGTVGVDNLYNVFGWWEGSLFGASLSNEAGIPYYKINEALTAMFNGGGNGYGSPLLYKGIRYGLDLSNLPSPPTYYRIAAPNISILELISTICEDGGCDYFIEMIPGTTIIRVRTVSRVHTVPLGKITSMQGEGYGVDLIRSSAGLESVNEITSAFVVGGQQQILYQLDSSGATQFWGLDVEGAPIMGWESGFAGLRSIVNLNSSSIADAIGLLEYSCELEEMLCALQDKESWLLYMNKYKDAFGRQTGIGAGPTYTPLIPKGFADDKVKDDQAAIKIANESFKTEIYADRVDRLYRFVHQAASEYLGRKYLVPIPFILQATEPETFRLITSMEVASDGGYLPDGSLPLGLPELIEDKFKSQDGKFEAFCLFQAVGNIDSRQVNLDDMYITSTGIYMKVQVDPQIYFTPAPMVLVTLSNPLYEMPADPYGYVSALAAQLGTIAENLPNLTGTIAGGAISTKMHTAPKDPSYFAIPLKSNIITYGPWYLQGAPGKVRFEYDPSLTPWQYGGHLYMNQAGQAKVSNGVTFMQEIESGTLEFAGAPLYSMGDLLQGNGPCITNIDVSYGPQGVTTIYRMSTFTPKLVGTSKDTLSKIQRLGRSNSELRKGLREAVNRKLNQNINLNSAIIRQTEPDPSYISRKSPHTTLLGVIDFDSAPTGTGQARTSIATGTYAEVCTGCGGDDASLWKRTSVMSLTGLIRPIEAVTTSSQMSHYTAPSSNFTFGINSTNYNPFISGNDINSVAAGSSYIGMNQYKYGSANNPRVFALRGPLLISGWGVTIDGKVVPGDDNGNPGDNYVTGVLAKPHLWKTGAVDNLWDNMRGVWTSHDILIGKMDTNIGVNTAGTGIMRVYSGTTDTGYKIPIKGYFIDQLPKEMKVIAGYCVTDNSWRIISNDKNYTVTGTTVGQVLAGGSGLMNIGTGLGGQVIVHNWFSTGVSGSVKVIANYVSDNNRWYIVAADCT